MKIISRPDDMPVGTGQFTVKMDYEELQYIGALVYNTRLGSGDPYKEAAFKLNNMLEELFGEDFISEAAACVDFSITIEDDRGNMVEQHGRDSVCIEV